MTVPVANGSKSVPKLGVLQLKTNFPRPPGDVANALTWDMPVVIRVVEEATGDKVVGGTWGQDLVDAFVREGEKLIQEGCVAFVTSCGFVCLKPNLRFEAELMLQLATMHPLLAGRLPYMGTSSLLQVAWLQNSFFPGPDSKDSIGVITFKKSALVSQPVTAATPSGR